MKSKKFSLLICASCMFLQSGCTIVRYTDADGRSLTIADVRISGSAIDLDAAVPSIGTLSVNREQGSAAEGVATVVDAVRPSLLP